MKKKKAFITGITGQDGSYLLPLLLDEGYVVHALASPHASDHSSLVDEFVKSGKVTLHRGSLTDLLSIRRIMESVRPDEIYNLAALSSVSLSFKSPVETWDVNYYGVGRLVNESLRVNPRVRIYQASTSEMFGNSPAPQNEKTDFDPQSPYAEAKLRAHEDFIVNKRKTVNAFAVSGILFNHESPRRGKHFVTRKITYSLARIAMGSMDCLELGNLNAVRDWGHAEDYVQAMFMMLQQKTPEDYIIASGVAHSVRDFVEIAASHNDITIAWEGSEESEVGRDVRTGKVIVKVNSEFYRPQDVNFTQGDASKAKAKLGWEPRHSFNDLVAEMVLFDRQVVQNERK